MPTKVFTLMGGKCPFGKGCDIDTESCRKCEWYYRAGTGTFFWCRHPIEQEPAKIARKAPEIARKAPEIAQPKRKRGRPPGKAAKKPVKQTKKKKQ